MCACLHNSIQINAIHNRQFGWADKYICTSKYLAATPPPPSRSEISPAAILIPPQLSLRLSETLLRAKCKQAMHIYKITSRVL